VYDFSDGKNIKNSKHWEIMKDSDFKYEIVEHGFNHSDMPCEPIYENYLEEINYLINKPNEIDDLDNDVYEDSVKFNNVPLNFDDEQPEIRASVIIENTNNDVAPRLIGDYFKEAPNAPNLEKHKLEEKVKENNYIPSDFEYSNSIKSKNQNKNDSEKYFNLSINNFNNNNEINSPFLIGEYVENSSNTGNNIKDIDEYNILNENDRNNNNFHKIKINQFDECSPNSSEGSGDIVIIDSNPKILKELSYTNKNEIHNDFDVVNSFNSNSDSFKDKHNGNKSPSDNFVVLENEDTYDIEYDHETKALKRLSKDNQEIFQKIREIQDYETKSKAELREKACDFLNTFKL